MTQSPDAAAAMDALLAETAHDDDDFTASLMCCACGGGYTPSVNANPLVAPLAASPLLGSCVQIIDGKEVDFSSFQGRVGDSAQSFYS